MAQLPTTFFFYLPNTSHTWNGPWWNTPNSNWQSLVGLVQLSIQAIHLLCDTWETAGSSPVPCEKMSSKATKQVCKTGMARDQQTGVPNLGNLSICAHNGGALRASNHLSSSWQGANIRKPLISTHGGCRGVGVGSGLGFLSSHGVDVVQAAKLRRRRETMEYAF